MCTHMIYTHLRFQEHQAWIESYGINFGELCGLKGSQLGRGNYKPLMEVVEKECKIT